MSSTEDKVYRAFMTLVAFTAGTFIGGILVVLALAILDLAKLLWP